MGQLLQTAQSGQFFRHVQLTAMLALNVSSSILEGFTMVDNSLHTTIESSEVRNKLLYADFQDLFDRNPDKVREWLDKANLVKKKSDSIFNYIHQIKFSFGCCTNASDKLSSR